MRKNNKGFSLVELIVAFAIAAIAGTAVYGMMAVGGNNFRRTSNDVGLQYEQQIAVNQIRDYILESSNAIHYDESEKSLYVFRQTVDTTGSGVATPSGTPSGASTTTAFEVTKLLFTEPAMDGDGNVTAGGQIKFNQCVIYSLTEDYKTMLAGDGAILANDVKEIEYDLTQLPKNKVSFKITFLSDGKEITSEQVVSLRNTIVDSDELSDIYNTTRIEINSFIKSILIKREGSLITGTDTIGMYGDKVSVKYEAEVIASSEESTREYGVVWSVEGVSAGVTVDTEGLVTIDRNVEGKPDLPFAFTLVATSVDDPTKSSAIVINVDNNGIYPTTAVLVHDEANMYQANGYTEYVFVPTINYTGLVADTGKNFLTGDAALDRIRWSIKEVVKDEKTGANVKKDAVLPATKYDIVSGIDTKTGKLCLSNEANGHTYYISYTVIQRDKDGEVVHSNEITLNVQNIKPYNDEAQLKMTLPKYAKRADVFNVALTWTGNVPAKVDYYYNIMPYSDNESGQWYATEAPVATDFSQIVKIKDSNLEEVSGELNSFGGFVEGFPSTGWHKSKTYNAKVISVDVKSYLDWNKGYKIKVVAFAVYHNPLTGKDEIYDANGKHIYDSTKPVAVKPIEGITEAPKVVFRVTPCTAVANLKRCNNGSTVLRTENVLQPAPKKGWEGDLRAYIIDAVGYYISAQYHNATQTYPAAEIDKINQGSVTGLGLCSTMIFYDNSGDMLTNGKDCDRIRTKKMQDSSQCFYFQIDTSYADQHNLCYFDKNNVDKMKFYLTLIEKTDVTVNGKTVPVTNICESNEKYVYTIERYREFSAND